MSEKKPNMLIIAIILVIAGFTITSAVSEALKTVDLTEQHPTIITIVQGAQIVFAATGVVFAVGFGRNILGYGINWLRHERKGDPHVDYSISWLGQTIMKFESWVLIVTPFINIVVLSLPEAYKEIGLAASAGLFALIDIIISEIKYVIAEAKKEPLSAEAVAKAGKPG